MMPIIEPDSEMHSQDNLASEPLQRVESNSIIDATVGIHWQGQDCRFSDYSFLPNINLWRDFIPPEIEPSLPGCQPGDAVRHQFAAGELVEAQSSAQQHQVKRGQFQPPRKGLTVIQPRLGRFYPKDFFVKVDGIYEGNKFPCRITALDPDQISVDMNHPLAGKALEMSVQIESVRTAGAERGGRCKDIASTACDHGPGLQDRLPDAETDFFSDHPFSRLDPGNDRVFFQQPDLQPFWDEFALQQVSQLYSTLIKPGRRVLDLMAGAHSPLQQADVETASVVCAGLNQTELEHNPVCTERVLLDVNAMDALPADDAAFDVVLIHAAIEYVIDPKHLFGEIARVLAPGGRVIITFSNRSVPQKAIQLWAGAHEFERPGIVLAYLRESGQFGEFSSFSLRGHLRPQQDRLAQKLLLSEPVYAIWANRL